MIRRTGCGLPKGTRSVRERGNQNCRGSQDSHRALPDQRQHQSHPCRSRPRLLRTPGPTNSSRRGLSYLCGPATLRAFNAPEVYQILWELRGRNHNFQGLRAPTTITPQSTRCRPDQRTSWTWRSLPCACRGPSEKRAHLHRSGKSSHRFLGIRPDTPKRRIRASCFR
jgi:hypothetical protein